MGELTPPWAQAPVETVVEDRDGPWKVTDLGSAEWAMERLRESDAAAGAIAAQYATWKAQLDQWRADAEAPLRRSVEFFTDRLEQYALEQRRAGGAATVKLPGGKVTTRENPEAIVLEDPETFLDEAGGLQVMDSQGELVSLLDVGTKRTPQVSLIRDHVVIVDVPAGWTVTWPCGDSAVVTDWDVHLDLGSCPACGAEGPGSVEPRTVRTVRTANGDDVPGLAIRPATVTATVKPAPPAALADPGQPQLDS